METCDWNAQMTLPPDNEQFGVPSRIAPNGAPGINGLNEYAMSTRFKRNVGASGSASMAGNVTDGPMIALQVVFVAAPVPLVPTEVEHSRTDAFDPELGNAPCIS